MSNVVTQMIERQMHRWDRINAVLKKGAGAADGTGPLTDRPLKLPVITISRQVGSGGRVVAQALSERLGMDLFGISIIDAIAESGHLDRRLVDTLDENVRSDIENHVAGLLHGRAMDNQEYAARLIRTMLSIASHGMAIILGRGGTFAIHDHADLRLRFHAPVEFRVRNMMEYEKLIEKEARKTVAEVDEQRRLFAKRLFNADLNDPKHYDLIIDTSRIRPDQCVELAILALKLRLPRAERAALRIDGP